MADFVVGRSEGIAYSNNNFTNKQFEVKDKVIFIKHMCSTCRFENNIKNNFPCNFCSLDPRKKDNWQPKS